MRTVWRWWTLRRDRRIVREGSDGGGGGVPIVSLCALVGNREYVERYKRAVERLREGRTR
jgi:hypothetical protein